MSNTPKNSFLPAVGYGNLFNLIQGNYYPVLRAWDYRSSSAGYWRFYWNPRPGAEIHCGQQHLLLDESRVVLIPPFTVLSSHADREFSHFFLHFQTASPFDRVKKGLYALPAEVFGKTLPQALTDGTVPQRQRFVWMQLALQALLLLKEEDFLPPKQPGPDPRIQLALKILNESSGGCSNAELCARINMSPSNFFCLFKAETGFSPQRYQLNLRLERAAHFLIASEMTIKEIAAATGFADRYHFSKAFKNFFRLAPVEFRNRNQGSL